MTDFDKLRAELSDYYGTAAFCGNPAAFIDLEQVQSAPNEALLDIAREAGMTISDFSDY